MYIYVAIEELYNSQACQNSFTKSFQLSFWQNNVLILGTFQTTIYVRMYFQQFFQKQFILHLCIPFTQHSSYLCTHTCTCVCTYVCTCLHICTYVHMYCITCMESVTHIAWVICRLSSVPALYSKYVRMHVRTLMCMYLHMCAMAEWGWRASHTSLHTCQHEDRLWLSLCTYICTYVHTCVCTCTIVKLYVRTNMSVYAGNSW